MNFKTFQLIVDGKFLTLQEVQKLHAEKRFTFQYNNDLYMIESEIIDDRFWWFYCQYENSILYNTKVWNCTQQIEQRNPRRKNQVEFRKQLFICYDIEHQLLYMSNMTKRGFFEECITQIASKAVTIKNIYSSLDDFQTAVETLKSIKFIQHNSIANNTTERNTPFEQLPNIYGCDAPERLYMELDYNNSPIKKFTNFLKTLKNGRDQGQFESIIIVGEDAEKVEHSFDFSSIISSVEIKPIKDDNGRYEPSEVQNMFLELIR